MNFNEALLISEEATDDLSHFVGEDSLEAILRSRHLRGSQYNVSKLNLTKSNGETPKELCLVRKGLANKPESLSGNSGKTRFLLDMNNILTIRNVKKPYPIAELPIENKGFLDKTFERLYDYGMDDDRLNKLKQLVYHKPMLKPEQVKARINEMIGRSRGPITDDMKRIIYDYEVIYDKVRRREGEERLDLSKAIIPLKSKYVKIVLAKEDINEKIKRMVRTKFKYDPELFYDNDVLRSILKKWNLINY